MGHTHKAWGQREVVDEVTDEVTAQDPAGLPGVTGRPSAQRMARCLGGREAVPLLAKGSGCNSFRMTKGRSSSK